MRKLGLISSLWAALLFFPLTGNALGLGEIEISSFLNQPLKAEISVISARPGEVDDLLISLASRDAFQKAGLDRPAELSKLRFSVEKSEDGESARILVSTKTPVVEPFLSFLVEADWAKGRLLREFTVLLDPPSFAQQAVEPAAQLVPEPQQEEPASNLIARKTPVQQQAVSQPANSQQIAPQPIAMTGTRPSSQIPVERTAAMPDDMGTLSQVVVNRGDTLWRIASDLKDKRNSVAQMMLALQMMNPEAFGNDNINNLKVGSVLRVPDREAMNKLSKQEAQAQVLDQNGLWDEYLARKSGSTSSATPVATTDAAGAKKKTVGQLKLVAPGDGKSTNASLSNDASSADSNQLRKKLALAEEELEAARLKNNDLNSRVGILEQQLKKFEELQKLVQIQDNSLAQLQKSVANPTAAEKAVKSAPVVEVMQDPAPVEEEKPTSEMIAAADEIMAKDSDRLVEDKETVTPPVMEDVKPAMSAGPDKPADNTMAPAPVIVTEVSGPAMDQGFMDMLPSLDDLINDPVMLGGLGGVLAVLLGLLFLKKKKSEKKEEGITLEEPEDLTDDDPTPIHVPSAADDAIEKGIDTAETSITQTTKFNAGSDQSDVEEAEEEEDQFARTAIISADEMPEMEEATPSSAEQDDVLNEVDVYLAYGLYDNAEDLLKESLDNSPDRADYRAKLLDTYFATKNSEAFVKEATLLKSQGKAANRFWDRVQVMGHELAPENDLFSGAEGKQVSLEELAYAKPASADFDISADDETLSFSETDFDLSSDSESDSDSFDLSATQVMKSADAKSEEDELDVIDIDFPDLEEDEEIGLSEISESADLEEESADLDVEQSESLDDDSDLIASTENIKLDEFESDEFEDDAEELKEGVNIDDEQLSDESLSFDLSDEVEEIDAEDLAVIEDEDITADEEIDLTGDDSEVSEIELDPTQEAPSITEKDVLLSETGPDDDEVKFNFEEDDSEVIEIDDSELSSATQFISAEDLDTQLSADDAIETEVPLEDGLDFDMSDIDEDDLQTGGFTPSDEDTLSKVKSHGDDITEFKPADFTGEFEAFEDVADDAAMEVDTLAGLDKTGTFAPGDFNEESTQETAAAALKEIDDIDDIEDLMLPDDVDEVGTKLDLAKAFIDMGDVEGARSSLEEVLAEGTDEQKAEANELISQIN